MRIVVTRSETLLRHPQILGSCKFSATSKDRREFLLAFFTVVVSPLRRNPGALISSPLPQRREKQPISQFTKQCPEQRIDQYHQKVIVSQIHNTFRIQRHRENPIHHNKTLHSFRSSRLHKIKHHQRTDRHEGGTKRATPKQRESRCLSKIPWLTNMMIKTYEKNINSWSMLVVKCVGWTNSNTPTYQHAEQQVSYSHSTGLKPELFHLGLQSTPTKSYHCYKLAWKQ